MFYVIIYEFVWIVLLRSYAGVVKKGLVYIQVILCHMFMSTFFSYLFTSTLFSSCSYICQWCVWMCVKDSVPCSCPKSLWIIQSRSCANNSVPMMFPWFSLNNVWMIQSHDACEMFSWRTALKAMAGLKPLLQRDLPFWFISLLNAIFLQGSAQVQASVSRRGVTHVLTIFFA